MKLSPFVPKLVVLLAVLGLTLPAAALAERPSTTPIAGAPEASVDADADLDFSVLFSEPIDQSTLTADDFTIQTFDGRRAPRIKEISFNADGTVAVVRLVGGPLRVGDVVILEANSVRDTTGQLGPREESADNVS